MASRVFILSLIIFVTIFVRRSKGNVALNVSMRFVLEPQDAIRARGKNLTLPCSAEGAKNITWLHDWHPLTNDSRRKVLSDGSLFFKKLTSLKKPGTSGSDEGEYRCVAHNGQGAMVSKAARVQVAVLSHEFSEAPVDAVVEEDDAVKFTCQIESVPDAVISWEKNSNPLPHSTRFLVLDGHLYITKVRQSDAGSYRCVALNTVTKKERVSKEGSLTVTEKSSSYRVPQFLSPDESLIQVVQGKEATLYCVASGSPNPEISWTFRESQNSPGRPKFSVEHIHSIVKLKNVTTAEAGIYTCTATNSNSNGHSISVTQTITLEVWVPPFFTMTPTSDIGPVAKTVRLNCTGDGIPPPKIEWISNGTPVAINGRIKQNDWQLLISNTVRNESGIYQCLASNPAGEARISTILVVNSTKEWPDAPRNLTCRTTSANQVYLQWEAPLKPGYTFRAFTYHVSPTFGGEEIQGVAVNKSTTVGKLMPFTNYTFYIRIYYLEGASDPSEKVVCQTFEGTPRSTPELELTPTSPTTVRARWQPLPPSKAQGIIKEYKVQWRKMGIYSTNVANVPESVREYIITGLQPGEVYSVRILAATTKGWPTLSEDQLTWTSVVMPSDSTVAPVVHLTGATSTSIQVTWSLSSDAKYVPTGYKLYYRKQNGLINNSFSLSANITEYLLNDLEPETMYEVLVSAETVDGDSEVGMDSILTLPAVGSPTYPNSTLLLLPPIYIEAEPLSTTSVNLTWTPAPQDYDVGYYNVCYSIVPNNLAMKVPTLSCARSTSTNLVIKNLKPNTLYEFKIRSHDRTNRHGPYSAAVECKTFADIPGMVSEVQWKPLNLSSVEVTWKEPRLMMSSVVNSYEIAYSDNDSIPVSSWKMMYLPGIKKSAEIHGLEPNKVYFVTIRPIMRTGMGPYTMHMPLSITTVDSEASPTSVPEVNVEPESDRKLGIIVGVAVGMICVTMCAVAIVWWRKRTARRDLANRENCTNGNGYYYREGAGGGGNDVEMDTYTLSPGTVTSVNDLHLDTKGIYPIGQANGLKHPLLSNGRVSSGRGVVSVHITENPQYIHAAGSKSERNSQVEEHTEPLLESESRKSKDSHREDLDEDFDDDRSVRVGTTQMSELDVLVPENQPRGNGINKSGDVRDPS